MSKRTVLVVDDEQNMQAVMRMILEGAGHEVWQSTTVLFPATTP